MDEHGIFFVGFIPRMDRSNRPFGKRSLHLNRTALLIRCSFLISYNLISRKNINTDSEIITFMHRTLTGIDNYVLLSSFI